MAAELDLTGVYRQMLRIREFEERVKATFTEHPGVIRGHTHLADGAEASIAGARAQGGPAATPADAKGLMATAIRDDNPVCFFHHYLLTLEPGEVPEGEYLVPFGQAAICRTGSDVTIVATGAMVGRALAAASSLAGAGVSAEVIDPRTLVPLDVPTILESVAKTGRLVLVDQATRHASASAVIAAEVADQGFSYLRAPVKQVTALDATVPYSEPMEAYLLPDEPKIVAAVLSATEGGS
jgi:acetoin:2,6-dichlorophenolindophenol oxidoreductase subunit beta